MIKTILIFLISTTLAFPASIFNSGGRYPASVSERKPASIAKLKEKLKEKLEITQKKGWRYIDGEGRDISVSTLLSSGKSNTSYAIHEKSKTGIKLVVKRASKAIRLLAAIYQGPFSSGKELFQMKNYKTYHRFEFNPKRIKENPTGARVDFDNRMETFRNKIVKSIVGVGKVESSILDLIIPSAHALPRPGTEPISSFSFTCLIIEGLVWFALARVMFQLTFSTKFAGMKGAVAIRIVFALFGIGISYIGLTSVTTQRARWCSEFAN